MGKRFVVEFVICVDHPERRDESFRPVPAGRRSAQTWAYDTLRMFRSLLAGEWDFSSEYVAKARVLQDMPSGPRRFVRREVRRNRQGIVQEVG